MNNEQLKKYNQMQLMSLAIIYISVGIIGIGFIVYIKWFS